MSQLFRKQAVDAQGQRLVGSVTLAQPMPLKLTVFVISVTVLIALIFLFNAEYTRKETVVGFLRPNKGLIKSFSEKTGTIKEVLVSAGQLVEKGTPLVSIVSNRALENGEDVNQQLIKDVELQISLQSQELSELPLLEKRATDELNQQIVLAHQSLVALQAQKALIDEKLALLEKQTLQLTSLHQKGYISTLDIQQQRERHLTVKQESEQLVTAQVSLHQKISQLENQQLSQPFEYASKRRVLQQRISSFNSQLTNIKNNFSHVVKATHSGIVTDIHILPGETLNKIRPLLTILPHNSSLIAELMLPTRSAGFIGEGDITYLRFDAFPHQRFGFITGKVTRVDNALITQQDVNFPISITEPVYRLQAELNKQFIDVYDKKLPLKSGMMFQADIVLDKRSLFEWVIDPILSVKGKLR
ncbi:HlyD family efflux transporter periplasmic adaptor subunit [Thalassotalea sp. 1_MG-2023]|uniref:HlyD family secretion protein n=1 Tax=Thalassotalea sp. 1_MG-2023 TaxID=3062680 RepID=UPI0026E2F380|nr:HlyD family efflux transporter periplasmic adaptor subunit [Thalassotalea sp. 1_MG-2023]MDO6425663.1 HlyD family efflux transporter periplasmic adaptor subunit [Thalassotalea sp. 1_MG-2023]